MEVSEENKLDSLPANRECTVDAVQVAKASKALLCYTKKRIEEKRDLLVQRQFVWMQVALKFVPRPEKKPMRIPLPHTLHEGQSVCLLSRDQSKLVKAKLGEKNLKEISKVIGITKLRKNYKEFERKRQLCNAYGIFLCDERIYHLLPNLLGKTFFTNKKMPLPVNLKRKDFATEIQQTLQCSLYYRGTGPCSSIRVGHTDLTDEQLTHNILHTCRVLARIVNRGWSNVLSLNIKTSDSISLPIYRSLLKPTDFTPEPRVKPARDLPPVEGEKDVDSEEEDESDKEDSDNEDGLDSASVDDEFIEEGKSSAPTWKLQSSEVESGPRRKKKRGTSKKPAARVNNSNLLKTKKASGSAEVSKPKLLSAPKQLSTREKRPQKSPLRHASKKLKRS